MNLLRTDAPEGVALTTEEGGLVLVLLSESRAVLEVEALRLDLELSCLDAEALSTLLRGGV